MKKVFIRTIMFAAAFLLVFSVALAADFSRQTYYLNRLGIMQGDSDGFRLNCTPTRIEASVMVVRLLSCEEQALNDHDSHPFIDVPSWADDYVGFLYQKGIVKGLDSCFFEPYQDCSADMYLTFLLRALGYSDTNGDFNADSARSFALSIGLSNDSLMNELKDKTFLRGHMAALSFEALSCRFAGKENPNTLLDVWEAAHEKNDASAEIEKLFEILDKLRTALIKTAALKESEVHAAYSLHLVPGSEFSRSEVIRRRLNQGKEEASSEIEYSEAGITGWSKLYYINGTAYFSTENEKIKCNTKIETVFPKDENTGVISFGAGQILSYTEEAEGGISTITLTVDGSICCGKINVKNSETSIKGDRTTSNPVFRYSIDQSGLIRKQGCSFDVLIVSGDKKSYGIYNEIKTLENIATPIFYPSFKGYTTVSQFNIPN